jgi:hypothetical protein
MRKLLEVVEIWFLLNLATFTFIVCYRRLAGGTARSRLPRADGQSAASG